MPASPPARRRAERPLPYCELRAASAFSFLDGASHPEGLVARAAALELPAVALVDRGGVYGAPRFYAAARKAGLRALVGAEVPLDLSGGAVAGRHGGRPLRSDDAAAGRHGGRPLRSDDAVAADLHAGRSVAEPPAAALPRLSVLVRDRQGYRNLCRLLTAAARGRPKGEGRATWDEVAAHAGGLHVLTGGAASPVARALAAGGPQAARAEVERLAHLFDGRLHVEIERHRRRDEEHANRALVDLARRLALPLVATNGVRYARAEDKPLHDVLTCIRAGTDLDTAGSLLAAHRERHLKGAAEITALFPDLPAAVAASAELAGELDFTLADLGYRFPDYPLPPGETAASYLRHVTWNEARARFRPLTARAQGQLSHELALIDKLDLAGYFLIVWDVVRFCRREGILVQGRGSAANSAVCYALGITAVDPVRMELLFERFLSEERGEWPDIDLDLPSGDQREKVIQYVYRRYGASGAAMTANVITYRDRSATREVAKALGYSSEQIDRLAKRLGTWSWDLANGDEKSFAAELAAAGFDPTERRMRHFRELWTRLHHLPRHLGQHSGGMVIAAGRLDEVVPLEPASMPGRVVVQWDKDDCADLGIIKVDLLGLGMLNALEEAVPLIRAREGVRVDLAHLPPDDPETYAMIRAADTVGVFQIESRAQMSSLPRNAPRRFYDLVVQVAIIRPGPIAGKMASPYFERRLGRQAVTYPHPCLEPILERTLGVVLFQEQILKIAMVAAGFSPGEAEALRRAMGSKRSLEQMQAMEGKLRSGMAAKGLPEAAREEIVHAVRSFALYGFPESHAASFALLAYASAYLKAHHPAAFLIALLNAWPMGFYHPATLIHDARRHGVEVRPIDVTRSGVRCRWEEREGSAGGGPERGPRPEGGGGGGPERGRPPRAGAGSVGDRGEGPRLCSDGAGPPAVDRDPLGAPSPNPSGAAPAPAATDGDPAAAPAPAVTGGGRAGGRPRHVRGGEEKRTKAGEREVRPVGAVRLGLKFVRGLRREAAAAIEREQGVRAFADVDDLARRAGLREGELAALAAAGALGGFGLSRRGALWQVARAGRPAGPLLAGLPDETPSPLVEMADVEETLADYAHTGLTVGPHPLRYLRPVLERRGVVPAAELPRLADGQRVRMAGSVIVRQRPGTAAGLLFMTLEDETGMAQAIVTPDLLREYRPLIVSRPGLVVEGILQKRDGTLSVKAERFWPLAGVEALEEVRSYDFR